MATISQISPPTSPSSYSAKDINLLNSSQVEVSFDPNIHYIEYVINSVDGSYKSIDYNYTNYKFLTNGTVVTDAVSQLDISPDSDLTSKGLTVGDYNTYYNFYKNEILTSPTEKRLIIKDISADRTELTVKYTSPYIDPSLIINNFINDRSFSFYFQDFYLNFGDNITAIANNIAVDPNTGDILINLYSPLPSDIETNDAFWVVTKIADTLAFNISFPYVPITPPNISFPIKGPNFNLDTLDQINNSTPYQAYDTLITSSLLSTSYSQLNNLLSSSGININIDYTDFSNFIQFSSATQRLKNFIYKKQLIDGYQHELTILNNITTPSITSSNINILTNKINNIIENFDGYEYFLYYDSGSWSYPKSTSTIPYSLYDYGTANVLTWLGSDDPNDDYYGGVLLSASLYDKINPNYLYNTSPFYIQNDPQNDPYRLFIEMIAQQYDNIWIYYKDVTNRYDNDNRLDYGISKDLVAEALKSFGIKIYQNNFTSNDLYSSFLGYGSLNPEITSSLPVTADSFQEYISNYVTASYDASVMPLDDYNKEVYKRIYNNLPYLIKAKGTIPGLRALINCFGVPDTILRISEFGGRDKDTSTYDYFDQQYNYEYLAGGVNYITSSFNINSNWGATNNRPECIQFRIKPGELPTTNIPYSQSILILNTASLDISALILKYTGSGYTSSSYSGSTYSSSYQYANLEFIPRIGSPSTSASVCLPFYNDGWWSIMINRTSTTNYTLYAGNKLYYDGYDGNQIGFISSASVIANNSNNGGYNGDSASFASGSISISSNTYQKFSGSIQEIRFWSKTGSVEALKDFIMNPSSIDYENLENEYSSYLAFRLPLGNELYTGSTSVHPKISGSWVTTSSFSGNSTAYVSNTSSFQSNIESFFYDQPIAGIRNRVTDKIQIVPSSYPSGSVLSQYRSLEQTYPSLGSETPDINLLEVAFSPQNEIDNDIISSLGYFNIGEYIGDPRQVTSSNYPDLNRLSENFFQKYFASYDLFDYVRLIKYFDNSLFKMIKDFVPARTSLTSGVVIKQHLLERNKYPQPQVEWEELDYSGSITTAFMSGGTGGTFDSYNFTGSIIPPTFINNTQSWGEEVKTPVGLLTVSHSTQDEFYNGELPNSIIIATDGELNPDNPFKLASTEIIEYKILQYENASGGTYTFPSSIDESFFLSSTTPNPGTINTWFDNGGLTNPGNTKIITPGKFQTYFDANKTNGVKWIKINRVDNNGVDRSDLISQTTTLSFEFLNGYKTYNVATIQEQTYGYLLGIGPYAPGSMNNFNTGSANNNVFLLLTSGSTIFNPSSPNFDYNEYNPLLDNAEIPQTSVFFMDVDYSQNPLIPVNQSIILSGSADRAYVQDSNYTSYSWSGIRYNGSKYNSVKFN